MNIEKYALKWVVYGIVDPRDHLVFYIGYTRSIRDRKLSHKPNQNCRSSKRISELFELGLRPNFVVLQECQDEHHALRSEVFWIEMFRSRGSQLANHPDLINTESSPRIQRADDGNHRMPRLPQAIKKRKMRAEDRGQPERTGQSWDAEEDGRLMELFGQGTPIEDLSGVFQRTREGVVARLVKLGAVTKRSDLRPRRYDEGSNETPNNATS